MLVKDYTREFVDLKDVIVTKVENISNFKHIHIELERTPQKCPACGNWTSRVHDYRNQVVKDIDILGLHTLLHLRKRRYVCTSCGKKFQEHNTFLPKYQRTTTRLWNYVLALCSDVKSMKQIGKETNLSGTSIARIFDNVSYSLPTLPDIIGIDEFKGNSGGEKFNCILTNPDKRNVLDILPKRTSEALYEYFSQFENRDKVKIVTMDMSTLFRSVVRNSFPNAKIVADKYHVVRQVTWAFENVRKRIQKQFEKENRVEMKRTRKVLLKRQRDLTEEEAIKVSYLLLTSKDLGAAYYLKERFYEVMESKDVFEAEKKLKEWFMHANVCDLKEFNKCINTFHEWREEILNAFRYNLSNGYTEGCNNKIKVIKRTAFGLRNFERFRNRILYITSN